MNKFVGVLLFIGWIQQIVRVSAAPPAKIIIIEYSRDETNSQDDEQKLLNGANTEKSPELPVSPNVTQENAKQLPPFGSPIVVSVNLENKTETGNHFNIKFTDISYLLVCQIKFRLVVPSEATLSKHWQMNPVPGTDDQFTLPDDLRLYPGRAYDASVMLVGNGEPKIEILDTVTVLTTHKCPNDFGN
uniref:BsuPI domain-containing protein n=1 Tax=Globodera pallida TaxID=36090 RepID=A0A183C2I4_GLOPA